LGHCPSGWTHDYDKSSVDPLLQDLTWYVGDAVEDAGESGQNMRAFSLKNPRALATGRAANGGRWRAHEDDVAPLLRDRSANSRARVGVDASGDIALLYVVDEDSNVAFVGECAYDRLTVRFSKYLAARRPEAKAAEVLDDIVSEHDGSEARAFLAYYAQEPLPPWRDRDPAARQLDPTETPADVMATVKPVSLLVDLPASWSSADASLCTRIMSLAWGPCVSFSALKPGPPLTLLAYARPDEAVEIWANTSDGDMRSPLGRVGVISPDQIARGIAGGALTVRPAADVTTGEDYIEAASANRHAVVVTP
jgi:hypothetical protein